MRRMDRYKDENTAPVSRLDKNQELYQNFSNNTIYTNITDVTNANAYDISGNSRENRAHTTREAYQQMRKYQDVEDLPKNKKELDDFNYLYQRKENKVYDINSVLEEARKNRQDKDEKDEKRRLKNNEYNILSGVNKKELEKYREEKKKRLTTPEEEEIRELIDTIASKTLAGEIDKATSVNLLSDLMATSMLDKVESSEEMSEEEMPQITASFDIDEEDKLSLSKKILDTQEVKQVQEEQQSEKEKEKEEEKKSEKDPDFYTRSMDLSDKDFNLSDEFKEEQLPLPIKILIFLVIICVIALAVYFIYQRIH